MEELDVNGVELVDFGMGVSPQEAPDASEQVTIGFESGVPTTLNGSCLNALEMVEALNEIAGRNGIGRIDMVENRFVGMKSRGVYESPGMTVLYDAACMLSNSQWIEICLILEIVSLQKLLKWFTTDSGIPQKWMRL